MDWICFSPHLDDAALSVGGLIWEQSNAGEDVSIWTICAGDPPFETLSPFADSLHRRWGVGSEAVENRRVEDIQSCNRLGADYYHFDVPDCIYRRSPKTSKYLYDSEESLWGPIHPDEKPLIDQIKAEILDMIPLDSHIVCPSAVGNHVDHQLTKMVVLSAVESAAKTGGLLLHFYAEYPYVLDDGLHGKEERYKTELNAISSEGIHAWQDAISAHESQISTFWQSLDEMKTSIQSFYDQQGGIWLGK